MHFLNEHVVILAKIEVEPKIVMVVWFLRGIGLNLLNSLVL